MASLPTAPQAIDRGDRAGPLRILVVTNLYPEKDSYRGNFVQRFVESLRSAGHHVDVEVVAQSRGRLDYLAAAWRVRARARQGAYDVVHVHFGMTALAARFVRRIPRVLTLYGSDINVPWKRWITRLGWGGAVRIYVSASLAAAAGEPAAHVIANGVDFARFAPGARESARASLGLRPDDQVVLFGGGTRRRVKGYDLFREVLGVLKGRGIHTTELILSAPRQPPSQVVAKLDAADLLLFTSQRGSEGSPTVVKEAIAMGLPVVSVDVGDVGELLAGVEPSAVVAFPDLDDPLQARAELVSQLAEQTARILGARARSNGRESIGWLDSREVAERVVTVYREAIRGASHRARGDRPSSGLLRMDSNGTRRGRDPDQLGPST